MDYKRTLSISDAHIPFCDQYALELVVKIVGVWQPHRIIENGDMGDFYDVSDFDRNPDRLRDGGLQRQFDQMIEFNGELRRAAPEDTEIDFLPGNHDDRLRRYIWRHPQLFGLRALELPALLELERHRINYYPDEVTLARGGLVVKHGSIVRKAGGMSALAELEAEKYAVSTLTGHTHRIGCTMVRTRRGLIGGWENGCLCNLNPEWIKRPNWQLGVVLINESADGESFSVNLVPFLGEGCAMKAVVEGRTVRL
jgi:predicted phosphodiesterase